MTFKARRPLMIGNHKLVIRGCSINHDLIELNVYVTVVDNYPPQFKSSVERKFELDM